MTILAEPWIGTWTGKTPAYPVAARSRHPPCPRVRTPEAGGTRGACLCPAILRN